MTQYKTIAGVRYERDLLEYADEQALKSGRRPLPKQFAINLWEMAMDGNRVTETEQRTIRHIMENQFLGKAALAYLKEQLAQGGGKVRSNAKLNSRSGSKIQLDSGSGSQLLNPKGVSTESPTSEPSISPMVEARLASENLSSNHTSKRKAKEADDSSYRNSKAQRIGFDVAQESEANMISILSPELQKLLADAYNGTQVLALEYPSLTHTAGYAEIQSQRAEAQREVERILNEKSAENILGTGSKAREDFKRLIRLLHPDRGFVAGGDEKAKLAWRLVLAARQKIPQ